MVASKNSHNLRELAIRGIKQENAKADIDKMLEISEGRYIIGGQKQEDGSYMGGNEYILWTREQADSFGYQNMPGFDVGDPSRKLFRIK